MQLHFKMREDECGSHGFKIILGSASRTRREILAEMGYQFEILTADIDENAIRKDNPHELVMALGMAKADAIIAKLEAAGRKFGKDDAEPTLLITGDQVVVHEGRILEKPRDENEARQFIQGYSRAHATTVGSVIVTNLCNARREGGVDSAEIYFHPIPEDVILQLLKDELTYYSAGGLMVEHPLVNPFVKAMVGTMDSVMGLSKELTASLVRKIL